MVLEPQATRPSAKFRASEIERLAEQLIELLDHPLSNIASNRGFVTLFPHESRSVADMSDVEVSAYLVGVHAIAANFGAWLEEYSASGGDEGDYTESTRAIIRHGAQYDQIKAAIAGAEGECFQRRHPGKGPFAGKLRKINETIVRIRAFRVQLEDMEFASDAASDFAYSWFSPHFSEVENLLRKSRFPREPLSDEQRQAWKRVELENVALKATIDAARKAASDRRQREYEARRGKGGM